MMAHKTVEFFQRHSVPLMFVFEKGTATDKLIMTAFVMSVSDNWFLITAGHCIRSVDKILKEGARLVSCQLIDSLGLGAKHYEPIPFNYDTSEGAYLWADYPFDYGVIPLSEYYKGLLTANKIVPLDEQVWKSQPHHVNYYWLLGVPGELISYDTDSVKLIPVMIPVNQITEKPDGFDKVDVPIFYGKIDTGDIDSIKGMSGGPIFAFQEVEDGVRYYLIAIQSSWLRSSGYIAACYAQLLGEVLEKFID